MIRLERMNQLYHCCTIVDKIMLGNQYEYGGRTGQSSITTKAQTRKITVINCLASSSMYALGNQLGYTNHPNFDYMVTRQYTIQINVSDATMRGIPGNVTVNILDVEEPPVITSYPEVVAIPEDVAVGTVIAEVGPILSYT